MVHRNSTLGRPCIIYTGLGIIHAEVALEVLWSYELTPFVIRLYKNTKIAVRFFGHYLGVDSGVRAKAKSGHLGKTLYIPGIRVSTTWYVSLQYIYLVWFKKTRPGWHRCKTHIVSGNTLVYKPLMKS